MTTRPGRTTVPARSRRPAKLMADLLPVDAPEWGEVLRAARHDFYHLPAYVALSAIQEHGRAVAVRVTDGERTMLLPLVVREIPGGGRDAASPYGYPGPIGRGSDDPAFLEAAFVAAVELLRDHGIVSAFVRLHPLLNPAPPAGLGGLVCHGETVSIDLAPSKDEMWARTRENHRRDIGRATRMGFTARMDDTWERFGDFKRLYRGTMARRLAAPFYLFDDAYFEGLREALGPTLHLCVVERGDELSGAGLFVETDGLVEYHLSGSADGAQQFQPTKLMLHFVRGWAKDRGDSVLHLGGGVGAEGDSLLRFKLGFSPIRQPFSTLRLVIDTEEYARLVTLSTPGADPTDLSGYFPLYRRGTGGAADAGSMEAGPADAVGDATADASPEEASRAAPADASLEDAAAGMAADVAPVERPGGDIGPAPAATDAQPSVASFASRRGDHRRRAKLVLKAVADRAVATVALVALAPSLAAIAAAIRVDSRGPVFYRQGRAGKAGEPFRIFKFRSMIDGAEHIGLGRNAARDDPRITRMGHLLRTTSLDELPQLINVVLGQMSIVGPRPAPLDHLPHYTEHQRRRLEMRPGITGWAQVNGRNALSWEERIDLDVWYVDHWDLPLDMRILLRTPAAMLSPKGLYGERGITMDLAALAAATRAAAPQAPGVAVDGLAPGSTPATEMRVAEGPGIAGEFRVVKPGDEEALAELFADIDESFFRPHPFTADEAARLCAYEGRDVYAMLIVDGRPVAYGMLRGWDEGYDTPSLGIAVRNDAQGRGLGRLMMGELHAAAIARGSTRVRLRVHPENVRARRLYETLGYAYQGEDRGELVMIVDIDSRPTDVDWTDAGPPG